MSDDRRAAYNEYDDPKGQGYEDHEDYEIPDWA